MEIFLQNSLPIEEIVDNGINWITENLAGLFRFTQLIGDIVMDFISDTLTFIPPLVLLIIISVLAYIISNKKKNFAFLTALGLLFIYNQGLWDGMINTFTLVLIASLKSIVIGIPLGIWMSKSDRVRSIINPILDFMQTMPAFVYLIPAVAFFGIGMVPVAFASVIFALPPTVRFTNLGIREIPDELIEAAESFGSTEGQRLFKVELPLAKKNHISRCKPNNYVSTFYGCHSFNDWCSWFREWSIIRIATCGNRCWICFRFGISHTSYYHRSLHAIFESAKTREY